MFTTEEKATNGKCGHGNAADMKPVRGMVQSDRDKSKGAMYSETLANKDQEESKMPSLLQATVRGFPKHGKERWLDEFKAHH